MDEQQDWAGAEAVARVMRSERPSDLSALSEPFAGLVAVGLQELAAGRHPAAAIERAIEGLNGQVGRVRDLVYTAAQRLDTGEDARDSCNDAGNARRLAAEHGHEIRWVIDWKRWAVWDGERWLVDSGCEMESRAIRTADRLLRESRFEEEG